MTAPQPSEPVQGAPAASASTMWPGLGATRAVRDHRWGFGAFFLAEAVFIGVSVLLGAVLGDVRHAGENLGVVLLIMLTVPTLLAGGVAVVITFVRGNGPRADFGLHWRWSDIVTGLWIGGIGLVFTTGATMLWTRWMGEGANSAIGGLLDGVQLPPSLAVLIFLHVWLIAPVCEELLYRGLLWGAMERLRWQPTTVFLLSTAGFAIGHLEPERTLLLLVIAVPIGWARVMTGRLTASVVAHQVNNFLPALGLLLMSLGLLPPT